MILISHRGNTRGPNRERENNPDYINEALFKGFHVEVDVWYNRDWYLGHDNPQYKIDLSFLENHRIWCHAKNLDALSKMLEVGSLICFWHEEDTATLTNNGYIWTYPGKPLVKRSIAVLPEQANVTDVLQAAGICSDYVEQYL